MNKVLVIGDSCRDVFKYGRCDRLSPEAPVPIFVPTIEKENWGMALNVMKNIKALGVKCDIITSTNQPTKTRLVDEVSNQIIVRIDEEDKIGEEIRETQINDIDFSQYDAVVISDYNKYFLTEEIIELIAEKHPLTFIDSKKVLDNWINNIKFVKINQKEFENNSEWLVKYYEGELIVTKGKEGAKHWFHDYPIDEQHQVMDLSGAGDTFMAALVVKYLENQNIDEAMRFANRCASWVVTQKGVVVIKPEKIWK